LKQNIFKFIFDIVLAVVFALLFIPGSTGLTLHEWGSVVFGLAIILHIILNWKWVIGISKRIFSKSISRKTRLSYVLNWALLVDLIIIIMSGLLISEVLLPNFRYFPDVKWLPIHIVSSFVGLLIMGMHLGLHWNCIKQMGKQFSLIQKLFSFHRPSPKTAAYILLTIGTIAFLAQVPKQVLLTQAIFSDQNILQEGREHGKGSADGEREFSFENRELNGSEVSSENGERNKRERKSEFDKNAFSILRLLGSIPVVIIYLSMLASLAFYTRKLEIRYL